MLLNGLETERLRFRNLEWSDAEIWIDFLKNPDAVKYYLPIENAEEYSQFWMKRQLERYATDGFGLYALIDKTSKDFIGQCGIMKQIVDDKEELEIGYHVLPKFWHQGFAGEAAIASRDFAFKNNLSDSIISIIHPENIPSQKVAIKNGMTLDKKTMWRNMNVWVFRINKKTEEANQQRH